MNKKKKLQELRSKIQNATTEEFEILEKEIRSLQTEIQKDEEIERRKKAILSTDLGDKEETEQRGINPFKKPKVSEVEERKAYTEDDKVYRNAWAKTLMLQTLNKEERKALHEVNSRTLGSALTSTSETYVEPTELVDGVNNGGLLIPSSVMLDLLQSDKLTSPILQSISRLGIKGKVSFPYKKSRKSGAEWVKETEQNKDGSIEWAEFKLTGKEISETIRITWKLETMTPDMFVSYIISELRTELENKLATGVIYGTGTNDINGISNTEIQFNYKDGDNLVEHLLKSTLQIPKGKRKGVKMYVSDEMYIDVSLQKDGAGNYIYPPNQRGEIWIGKYLLQNEPYLMSDDYIVGNISRYYKLNESEKMSITKDVSGRNRINDYTAYAIYDGNFEPGTLVFGTKES